MINYFMNIILKNNLNQHLFLGINSYLAVFNLVLCKCFNNKVVINLLVKHRNISINLKVN